VPISRRSLDFLLCAEPDRPARRSAPLADYRAPTIANRYGDAVDLEPLTRLIESSDFLSFRQIALQYLTLKGYRDVQLKDGWNDGGSDFAVGVLGANTSPLGIQVTVQRTDWKSKVQADARRAQSELGLDNMIYVTSRRLAQADFTDVADQLWERDGITVRPVDAQGIASFLFTERATSVVLDVLGIAIDTRRPDPVPRANLAEDAAYAFVFFGGATDQFRRSVVEQSLLSHLTRSDSDRSREATNASVSDALQLRGDQVDQVSSAVDRLQQDGRVMHGSDGLLSAAPEIADAFKTMRAVRESQWRDLAREVDGYLGTSAGLSGKGLERASTAVLESAGALVLGSAGPTGAAISMTDEYGPLRSQLRTRMRELATALSAARVGERALDKHLRELARMVSNSDIGRLLMAGELFVALASLRTTQFERAFGARGGLEIVLDASVAIPMLAGLLYEPGSQRFSAAAVRIYDQAYSRGIPLRLPRVYLEEAASHLIQAYDRYRPLLGDEDLRYSTNAFVAHFADLSQRSAFKGSFERYVKALGYLPRERSFIERRDTVMAEMLPLFRRYDIHIVDFEVEGLTTRQFAQKAVTFTAKELHLSRFGRLLEHDAKAIAYFMSREGVDDVGRIFCTWDSLHLRLRSKEGRAQWQALNPVMLGDVLVLTRTGRDGELLSTIDIAMELSELEGARGAAVLDALVRIEGDDLHDAERLRLASMFKDAYMQAQRDGASPEQLASAWTAWKGGSRDLLQQSRLPV
jgi:hypothetical protein